MEKFKLKKGSSVFKKMVAKIKLTEVYQYEPEVCFCSINDENIQAASDIVNPPP